MNFEETRVLVRWTHHTCKVVYVYFKVQKAKGLWDSKYIKMWS